MAHVFDSMARKDCPQVERAKGVEPSSLAWEARVMPLYDARGYFQVALQPTSTASETLLPH